MKPHIKYAGGKRGVLDQFKVIFPKSMDFANYYEPMVGSGAVMLGIYDRLKNDVIIGDASPRVCAMWKGVTHYPVAVSEAVGYWADRYNGATEDVRRGMFEAARTAMNAGPRLGFCLVPAEMFGEGHLLGCVFDAAVFIAVNRTCFNGLYRVNQQGKFNVPWGKYKMVPQDLGGRVYAVGAKLNEGSVKVEAGDYRATTHGAIEGDVVYFDPPYYKNFDQYTTGRFKWPEQVRLCEWAKELAEEGVKVFASNSSTPEIRDLWSWATCHEIQVKRTISCKAETRGAGVELLFEGGPTPC